MASVDIRRIKSLFLNEQLIALAFILFGVLLRLAQYAANRSLWLDEAMLSLNIVNRSFVELFKPLDYNQGAPIGFLLTERTIIQAFGNQDYVLRLLPLVAGCLSLVLMWILADRCGLKKPARLVAVGILALNGQSIYYSSEVKQYSSDVAVCLLLYIVASSFFEDTTPPQRFTVFGILGALALWFSYPALFALSGIGLTLVLYYVVRKDWRNVYRLILPIATWGLSFIALYFVSLRHLASNDYLINFWQGGFMPLPPWQNWLWFPNKISQVFDNPIGLSTLYPLALVLSVAGSIALFRRRWQWGLLSTTPIALTLLASGLRLYPFSSRLILFLAPNVILLVVEGVEVIHELLRSLRWATWGRLALAGLLLYVPLNTTLDNLRQPIITEHVRPLLSYVQAQRQPGDLAYIYYATVPAFEYYAPQYGFGPLDFVAGLYSREAPDKYRQEIAALRGRPRVWFFFSHVYTGKAGNEEEFIRLYLNSFGKQIDEHQTTGASVYLYDLSQ